MYLVCPKCLRAYPSPVIKVGFACPACHHKWEAPSIEFSPAYFCALSSLSVSLLGPSGKPFAITSFPAILGRDSDLIDLNTNLAVSKKHFKIGLDSGNITVTDLESKGGTFLNATQLPPNEQQTISPADILRISGVELRLELHFKPPRANYGTTREGPQGIQLSPKKQLLTIGGSASKADIRLQGLESADPIACLYPRASPLGWDILSLKPGSVLVNGDPILDYTLQPDDEVALGPFCYVLSDPNGFLRPTKPCEAISIATQNLNFSTLTVDGNKTILDDVTLEIPGGRLTAIIGQSGSGKSTLAKILIGALAAESGQIIFGGESITPSAYPERVAGLIAFVPQEDIVHPELTIEETLDYAASIRLPSSSLPGDKEARVIRVLGELELLEHRDKPISALSGGQRKRVNVAVELLSSPKVLFLDEPTTGLDTGTEEQILACLRRLARQGRTVVFITHSVLAMDMADHVVFLRDEGSGGRVVAQGQPTQLKKQHKLTDWSSLFTKAETGSAQSHNLPSHNRGKLSKLAFKFPSFLTLLLRYISIWASTPSASTLILFVLPAILGLLIRIAVPGDGPSGSDRILFGVICAFWLGMNQTVREIVKERTVMLREQFAGTRSASYLFSKLGFFYTVSFFQAVLLAAPMLYVRVSGSSLAIGPSDLHCPSLTFCLVLWAGLCVGISLGFLLSALCLFVRTKGEILAVLLVILVTLPQILFSPKVLDHLVEKAADYHSFILLDPTRKLAEIASYFTASRYLYLPLAAIQNQKGDYFEIFAFNGIILGAFSLCCLVLTWLSLELFIQRQRKRTHW